MSAPDEDLQTQVAKHRWPLYGSLAVVVFGLAAAGLWLFYEVENASGPTQGDGTGSVVSEPVNPGAAPPAQDPVGAISPTATDPTAPDPAATGAEATDPTQAGETNPATGAPVGSGAGATD